MHRIVQAHLSAFVKSWSLEAEDEASQFEMFANHAVISARFSGSYELDDVTTTKADDGMDGVAIVIDEEISISLEDTEKVFSTGKRNHDVDVIFVQAKRSKSFDLGDFLKFKESILRFVTQNPYACVDEIQCNARQIFDVVLREVPKIRNGKPSLSARYITTGIYQKPQALETARSDFLNQLNALGLFAEVDVSFIGRDELTALWVGTYSGINATLDPSFPPRLKITR